MIKFRASAALSLGSCSWGLLPGALILASTPVVEPTYSTLDEIQNVSIAIAVAVVLIIVLVSSRQMVRDLVNEHLSKVRKREVHMLEVTTAISQELQLQPLLEKVISTITEILDADRSTLFLYDATRDELWS